MARRNSGAGRVQPKRVAEPDSLSHQLPSMRQRRPVVFWVVIVGVVAMTLATVSSFVTIILS